MKQNLCRNKHGNTQPVFHVEMLKNGVHPLSKTFRQEMLLLKICLLTSCCFGQDSRRNQTVKGECLSEETKVCEDECVGVATNCIAHCVNNGWLYFFVTDESS